MRLSGLILLALPLMVAASAPAAPDLEPIDRQLERAKAEAEAADAQVRRHEQAADRARDKAAELRARQAAAAEAIEAAEARISVAETERRVLAAQLALWRQRLARQEQPVRSLLAGLALMAKRPPLLALLDEKGIEEFVRVRLLVDSTLSSTNL